jgi:hypothetical protein
VIREVTMYRVVCDEDGCEESPQQDEYYAWLQRDVALDEATNGYWYVGEFGEFCEEHAPRCVCGLPIRGEPEDEDGLCEDCTDEAEA